MIPRYFVVAESEHELQNPTSEEKLLLLGERLGLEPGSRVLDVASGRGGPALLLARAFDCRVEGIEIEPAFHAAAVERAAASSLSHLVSFQLEDATRSELADQSYDAALCLGASFVFGGLAPTVDRLASSVRTGGHVVVDWDRYETLHWSSVERWLAHNADDPDAAEIRARHARWKRVHLRYGRNYLGWAIFVGWKRPQ